MNMREFWQEQLALQERWVREHGETMQGYVRLYHGRYGRSVENAIGIYQADRAELERIRKRIAPRRPVR